MKMRKCKICKIYTFKENCPKCKEKTIVPIPPSFKLSKYGKYRRALSK